MTVTVRYAVSGDPDHVYVSDETGRIVATCEHLADATLIAAALNADLVGLLVQAGWQRAVWSPDHGVPAREDEAVTEMDLAILAREAASVLRGFYDDVTPCVHRLETGARCSLCGRARALLIECDALVEDVGRK